MNHQYLRGSEWRKWDLHVHTPESGMANNFFNDWDNYVKVLFLTAIENEVAVLGITDYFTIDGYKKLKTEYLNDDKKLKEIFENEELIEKVKAIKIFPNIEFRLKTLVGKNRINYHVIFSDEVSIKDIEENFLHDIEFVYEQYPFETSDKLKLKKDNLKDLGAKLKKEQPSFLESEFEVGCMNAVVDDEQIKRILLKKKSKFDNKYLIVLPADEDLSRLDWKSQDHNVRKGYIQHCNVFFATNINTIEFALGKKHNSSEEYLQEFKSFKPCICGCDAHSCTDIRKWLGQTIVELDENDKNKKNNIKKTTWIKANPTFEGLKQITYEPEGRVKIQENKPDYKDSKLIIDEICFLFPKKFTSVPIKLNPNLNVIIGGKSSGKSILLFCIAKTLLSDRKILKKDHERYSYEFEADFDFKVKISSGIEESIRRADTESSSLPEIKYIPQNYLSKLADPEENKKGNELRLLIRDLLLEDQIYKHKYDLFVSTVKSYDDKREIIINSYLSIKSQLEASYLKLHSLRKESVLKLNIETNESNIKQLKEKLGLPEEKIKEYNLLNEELTQISTSVNKLNIDFWNIKRFNTESVNVLSDLIAKKNLAFKEFYPDIKEYIDSYYDILDQTFKQISEFEKLLSVDESNRLLYSNLFGDHFNSKAKRKSELTQALEPFLLNQEIKKQIQELEKSVIEDKMSLANISLIKDEIIKFELALNEEKTKLFSLYRDTFEEYKKFIVELENRAKTLENDKLQIIGKPKFNFSLFKKTMELISDGRTRSYDKYDLLFNENLIGTSEFNIDEIIAELEKLFKSIAEEKSYVLKDKIELKYALKVLFDDYFFDYWDVLYDKDYLGKMSTGKASFVILMLIIGLSESKAPILIDQPEDNLDNRSISKDLIEYLKYKKLERQIILVTHNPNVVVNADSENIIVAHQKGQNDKETSSIYQFDYINGALEDSKVFNEKELDLLKSMGIKEHVTDIVEGGEDAFRKREKKYGLN